MTIVKQMRLLDIHELIELESSPRFDPILATYDLQPIFLLFRKKTMHGVPRELNYGAMIQLLIIRIVARLMSSGNFSDSKVAIPLLKR